MRKKLILSLFIFALTPKMALSETAPSGGTSKESGTAEPAKVATRENGERSGDSNLLGGILSAGMSAGLTATGYGILAATCWKACHPSGFVLVGMGALSAQQSGAHLNAADQGWKFAEEFDSSHKGPSGGSNMDLNSIPEIAEMNKAIEKMKSNPNAKVDFKNKKLTTKDGKSYGLSSFGSPGDMAAAGFSQEDIDKALSEASKLEKGLVAKLGAGGIGAGDLAGGGGALPAVSNEELDPLIIVRGGGQGLGDGYGSDGDRDPASAIAGMQKSFNGDPIGVAGDSIFSMMTRRYNVKKQQDTFFEEHEVRRK